MVNRRITTVLDWIMELGATYTRPVPEDEEAAASARCTLCGHYGLRYHPLIARSRYIAVAECPRCRHSVLF